MSAKALLDENPDPTEEEIRDALAGNLCRCTGYAKMIEAIQAVARGEGDGTAGKVCIGDTTWTRSQPPSRPTPLLKGRSSVIDLLRAPAAAPLAPIPLEVLVPEAKQQTPAVGQRVTRPDCRLHGLGQTKYIDDFYLPGMLYAKIKRAGIPSARIVSIDTKEAEAMPGVVAVLTGRDVPCNSFGPSLKDQPVLADTRVFHGGDGVAAVAAVTEQIATEALEKIKVEYELLTPVLDPLVSLSLETPGVHAPNPNVYWHKVIKKGDVEKGFAESYRVFEGTSSTQMVEHVPLEPHSSVATWDGNGRVTIYSTLGRITLGRADLGTDARHSDEPHPRDRHGGRRQLRRQERDHDGAGRGAPRQEDGAAGEVHVHAAGGVHLVHHASPAHHGIQDGCVEAGQAPGAPDPARARRRRLLLVERDDARQGVHSVGRPLRDREPAGGGVRRLHQQDDDRRHAGVRCPAGVLRLRVAHGRDRQDTRHRSARDTPDEHAQERARSARPARCCTASSSPRR